MINFASLVKFLICLFVCNWPFCCSITKKTKNLEATQNIFFNVEMI
jgi:hypothetical protein